MRRCLNHSCFVGSGLNIFGDTSCPDIFMSAIHMIADAHEISYAKYIGECI